MPWKLVAMLITGVSAAGLAACGGDDEGSGGAATQRTATAQTSTATTTKAPPQKPVTLRVNGEPRVVTLSRVNVAYCHKKTDVCAAIRGNNFAKLTPAGRRAVRDARRRKKAREAAEAQAERQRQLQQQQQQEPPPQSEPQGTTTG